MAAQQVTARKQDSLLVTAAWWAITIATLIVVDDLTFGPLFWLLSLFGGQRLAFAVAFFTYFTAQLFIIWQGTTDSPHHVARWFLVRLRLERRWEAVSQKEAAIHTKVVGGTSAILISPVIGGVLPPIILYSAGMGKRFSRRIGVVTSLIYAAEFAFLHGWVPGTI